MDQQKELLEAKYTSPSGTEFVFLWESVSKETELKTGIFTYPGLNGAHVQHQGGGPVSYPMVCIFNGEGHIQTADAFEAALLERGTGELQHPVYGIRQVIPTGNIKRDNDYVSLLNETQISITFTENISGGKTGKLHTVTADELKKKLDNHSDTAAENFAENITVDKISEQLQLQAVLESHTNMVNDSLKSFTLSSDISGVSSNKSGDASSGFSGSIKELKSNIKNICDTDNTAQNALDTARLVLHTLKMPAGTIADISGRIRSYTQLVRAVINQCKNDPLGINNIKNSFTSTRLFLSGALSSVAAGIALGISEQATNEIPENADYMILNNIITRETAIDAAFQLNEILQMIQDFEDSKIKQMARGFENDNPEEPEFEYRKTDINSFIDSNANSYLLLIELVHESIQLILNVSFAFPMRRTIRLDRDRNVIELCAEVYGSVHNYYLDKIIMENNLSIDEMEIIPMGREVTFYVKGA